jgi:outer membrane protein assembly factor BamB
MRPSRLAAALAAAVTAVLVPLLHADWPMAGRDASRNAVSPDKGPPLKWQIPGTDDGGRPGKASNNVRWQAQLGNKSTGGPVVAGGLVWVGTNNQNPRDPKQPGDASVLMCFRERDGKFLWQYVSPRLDGQDYDHRHSSMAVPLAERGRLWVLTNQGEVLCFDVGPLQRGDGEPRLLWKVDLIKDLGVRPAGTFCPMDAVPPGALGPVYKDWLYVVTGNGRDVDKEVVLAPDAPSLVCFNKRTGKVVWKDKSPGKDIIAQQGAPAALLQRDGAVQVVAAQGDGWLRGFEPATGRVLWKCNLNTDEPREHRLRPYPIAAPVVAGGRIYVALGKTANDPGPIGATNCWCIDPAGTGDLSPLLSEGPDKGQANPRSAVVWRYGGLLQRQPFACKKVVHNVTASCVVKDGLVYLADAQGYLHCLDRATGHFYWVLDVRSPLQSGPLWAAGNVYLGADDGTVWILEHNRVRPRPVQIDMPDEIHATPVYTNGVLYIMTVSDLYAIRGQ